MKYSRLYLIFLFALMNVVPAYGLVNYEEGRRFINGVQLLQSASNKEEYEYVPQFPRIATKEDGTFELLCLKYTDASGKSSGGLLHALVEFTLPKETLDAVQAELSKQVPNARIVGPVQLMEAVKDGQEGVGSFQVVSSVLSDQKEGGFTRSVITSGAAPLTPGSKAVVAAVLSPHGSTLLWDSLTGPTSDVSVSINAYYEAAVKGYNAKVTAEVSTVYNHFSRVSNVQQDYSKTQLRKVIDDLQRNGDLKVEVLDRSKGLGIDSKKMKGILDMVTDKLVELMFDHKSGWSKEPKREVAVEANQIKGRQERGFFSKVFGGAQDTKYFSDNQYVLKRRQDITRNVFTITLSQNSTIKVPVVTAGNLGGLYDAIGEDKRYFRIVNLEDPAFQSHTVHFQIDGGYIDSFKDTINFASINFRKKYPGQPSFTRAVHFTHEDVKKGKTIQSVKFPRVGLKGDNWTEYEYQVRWSLRDGPVVSIPSGKNNWIKARDSIVAMVPPFVKQVLEVDADRSMFQSNGISTALLDFATVLAGKPKRIKGAVLRAKDASSTNIISVYRDKGEQIAYRLIWHSPQKTIKQKLKLLDTDYLFISPPQITNGGGN